MRPLTLPSRLGGQSFESYAMDILRELTDASQEDVAFVADEFTVSNFTATRTLDASTATATDLANFIATFFDDIQRRGSSRAE